MKVRLAYPLIVTLDGVRIKIPADTEIEFDDLKIEAAIKAIQGSERVL